ncbi:MAG TPA: sigma-70 family RNA polymerase sigma factor [Thermoanaerobaculaceae bacterium]|nr:sigma-70 family RNA polymerase sigma factor [Thermoanaerobaculaceae bacterium]
MGTVQALPCLRVGGQEARKVEPADEAALFAALADGDRAAAEALVERTYRHVYALLCRLARDPDLAADLTQETYRRAWSAIGSFDGRSRFGTWLYRIATNAFLNHVRRPHAVVPLDEEVGATLADCGPRQDDEAIEAQVQERLRRAVLELPEELRFTVAARYWADAPVAEIARADGISEVAVRKRLKHAFRLLAARLQEVAS